MTRLTPALVITSMTMAAVLPSVSGCCDTLCAWQHVQRDRCTGAGGRGFYAHSAYHCFQDRNDRQQPRLLFREIYKP